ncbi:hypothetical protein HS088_TW10G00704 [Tripterygium wilfordii]|uniref:Galactose oxidase/kelch repeat superfamily protein n=1 Tax=Tripterygium wilfordii TaxID=458696 RepID=A0A7J7D5S9_TRIWF|nr:F-box/kelch-repeat protein At1g80440-like [Tripterygium wilfordii]KAF5741700.1 hypothetical protein HS088_TW10G00704 [Tripterygium wilfordii]
MELIPGLPNDIALDCLIHVQYEQFPSLLSVCRAWRTEVEMPEFLRQRKVTGQAQMVVVMAQARVNPEDGGNKMKYMFNPVYRLTLCEPETGYWCELPPAPGFENGLPMFCQMVSVGSDLVVLGGMDPVTWEVSNSVSIFNFVSAKWRCGTEMPGPRRCFFGCASDSDRTVYIAGGHDDGKNALRSAMAYDVANGKWTPLPDMSRERDECKAAIHRGKLHVIGGYCTELQGQFERSVESFDFATWQWDNVQEDLLKDATCPRTCLYGDDQLYMCHGGDVVALKGTTWQAVSKLPPEVCNAAYVTTWQGKLMVIGSERFGEPHMAYVANLKTYTWTRIETPKKYSGHVQTGCYLEI